jgi:hypothetical protein
MAITVVVWPKATGGRRAVQSASAPTRSHLDDVTRISGDMVVPGDERQAFDLRLGEEDAIERILVKRQQVEVAITCSLDIARSRQPVSKSPRRSRRGSTRKSCRRVKPRDG